MSGMEEASGHASYKLCLTPTRHEDCRDSKASDGQQSPDAKTGEEAWICARERAWGSLCDASCQMAMSEETQRERRRESSRQEE